MRGRHGRGRGHFDKASPSDAFSRLGPLTRRFPHLPPVHFRLGLLLLWSGEAKEARRQLELARRAKAGSVAAREAAGTSHSWLSSPSQRWLMRPEYLASVCRPGTGSGWRPVTLTPTPHDGYRSASRARRRTAYDAAEHRATARTPVEAVLDLDEARVLLEGGARRRARRRRDRAGARRARSRRRAAGRLLHGTGRGPGRGRQRDRGGSRLERARVGAKAEVSTDTLQLPEGHRSRAAARATQEVELRRSRRSGVNMPRSRRWSRPTCDSSSRSRHSQHQPHPGGYDRPRSRRGEVRLPSRHMRRGGSARPSPARSRTRAAGRSACPARSSTRSTARSGSSAPSSRASRRRPRSPETSISRSRRSSRSRWAQTPSRWRCRRRGGVGVRPLLTDQSSAARRGGGGRAPPRPRWIPARLSVAARAAGARAAVRPRRTHTDADEVGRAFNVTRGRLRSSTRPGEAAGARQRASNVRDVASPTVPRRSPNPPCIQSRASCRPTTPSSRSSLS